MAIALPIVVVNALVVSRGATVLLRLGEWPIFGQVDVTAEAIADGAVFGLRAVVVMIAFAVYSACVDPDRVLRALRPFAGRSALTATLISRLVPVAAADAARLRDAGRLRGPAAAPLGRATLARRLLTGSLDRAVDVAATLELRGYSLTCSNMAQGSRARVRGRLKSRYDARFYTVGLVIVLAAIAGKLLGADDFSAYPTIEVGVEPATVALSVLVAVSRPGPMEAQCLTSPPSPARRPPSQSRVFLTATHRRVAP